MKYPLSKTEQGVILGYLLGVLMAFLLEMVKP